jgi:D-alanine transaminase
MSAGDVVFLNGEFRRKSEAMLPLEERGLLFGDGVYEVLRYYGGRGFRIEAHLERLAQSLSGVEIELPSLGQIGELSAELVRRNRFSDCTVYWQFTRGAATRDPIYPQDVQPTRFALVYPQAPLRQAAPLCLRAITAPDLRWHRCSIKSLLLLPNVLARNAAARAGCDAAILCRGETPTESTSANLGIVSGGEIWTHPADDWILDGITRRVVLECARELGLRVHERPFRRIDMLLAEEVFLCGTTTHVATVAKIDGRALAQAAVGPITRRLADALLHTIARECDVAL